MKRNHQGRFRYVRLFIFIFSIIAVGAGFLVTSNTAQAAITSGKNLTYSGGGSSGKYHVFADGVDTSKPVGALLQFHGDGAHEFNNPDSSYSLGGGNGIVAAAQPYNLVVIPMLTPDGDTWWNKGSANADYVDAFIKEVVYGQMGVDPSKMWLAGYSGGAQFITQFYLPKYASTIQGGGSMVFGGGGSPRVSGGTFPESLKSNFHMLWVTGSQDDGSNSSDGFDALSAARAGESHYKGLGINTEMQNPNAGHNLSGTFGNSVAAWLAKYAGATGSSGSANAAAPQVSPNTNTQSPATSGGTVTGNGEIQSQARTQTGEKPSNTGSPSDSKQTDKSDSKQSKNKSKTSTDSGSATSSGATKPSSPTPTTPTPTSLPIASVPSTSLPAPATTAPVTPTYNPTLVATLTAERAIAVSGTGWVPNAIVTITSDMPGSSPISVLTDATGSFTGVFPVPSAFSGLATLTAKQPLP